jgi:thioredoxin 1
MPIAITKDNFEAQVKESSKPVILDVYAAWCGPCLHMAPIFEELEKKHGATYTFAKLNVDESRDVSVQLGVTSIPTFIFFKNGQVVGKETGYIPKETLESKITHYLG